MQSGFCFNTSLYHGGSCKYVVIFTTICVSNSWDENATNNEGKHSSMQLKETVLISPPPNFDSCNDTEDVLHSDSNDDLSGSVAYIPSEQSERNEGEPSGQSERNEDASTEAFQTSSTEAATAILMPSSKQRR
eukprot:5626410-Ditylum_brightwellii.AAC.1